MKNTYIKSCMNYTGGKYKLLDQLFSLFPEKVSRFYDLFGGGGAVAVNADKFYNDIFNGTVPVILNDSNSYIINLYQYFKSRDIKNLLTDLEKTIEKYKLSNTFINGYGFYGVGSSEGLAKINKTAYQNLKADYNVMDHFDPNRNLYLYLLIVYGFNNQIRFNKKGEFNLPVGKRDMNSKIRNKLIEFHSALRSDNLKITNFDYQKFTDFQIGDFYYCDPPYTISNASYNENGLWGQESDTKLFEFLDLINANGAKFALSNVIIHKGERNDFLLKWAENYKVHYLDFNYNNSNYQSKAKNNDTVEVLITNY